MIDMYKAVKEFHEIFECRIAEKTEFPDDNERDLRMRLLKEEYLEYREAEENDDFIEVADALADMMYIILGTAVSYGIPIDKVFEEVHNSNLTKLWNGKVKKRSDGKILKPDTFLPPNIPEVLRRHVYGANNHISVLAETYKL